MPRRAASLLNPSLPSGRLKQNHFPRKVSNIIHLLNPSLPSGRLKHYTNARGSGANLLLNPSLPSGRLKHEGLVATGFLTVF